MSYYEKGSVELAVETPVVRQRLATRRYLTHGASAMVEERLLIVLVGLPARGKSFIARKLENFFLWRANQCKIFNVGKYRRHAYAEVSARGGGQCDADFFDSKNEIKELE